MQTYVARKIFAFPIPNDRDRKKSDFGNATGVGTVNKLKIERDRFIATMGAGMR